MSGSWQLSRELKAIALIVAGAVILLVGFWLATCLGAMLVGGSWPSVRFRELLPAWLSWPSNLADPARGWPRPVRDELSGAGPFYAAAAALALLPAGLLVHGIATASEDRGWVAKIRGERAKVPTARWAGRSDLKELLVARPEPGRLVLGRWPHRLGRGPQLLAGEHLQSVLVVAPQRAGKTTGLAIPAVLEHQGPVISTSIRGDVLDATLARRQRLGQVMVFDPTGGTSVTSSSWSPLGHAGTWEGAQRMAFWLCASARGRGGGGMQDPDFWFKAAAKALAPHLLAAARGGLSMEEVVRWIETQEEGEVLMVLQSLDEQRAAQSLIATFGREPRQRSSIYTTVETVLSAYSDPGVMAASRSAEISSARLFDGGSHTLYLCGPPHEQERLAPLFGAMLEELVAVAYGSAAELGKPLDPPLLIVGDELANIAPIRSLPTIASTGAGTGIQLMSIFQDLAQLQARWGRDEWRTVANNHRARLFGTGNGDPETLDYVRRVSGEAEFEQSSQTNGDGRRSRTASPTFRSLAPANVVRESSPDTAVLIYGHKPPAKLKLRPYYRDRALRRLAGLEDVSDA